MMKIDKGTGLKLAPSFGLHAIPAPGGTRKGQWFYVGTIPCEVDPDHNGPGKMYFATEAQAVAHAAAFGWHCGNPTITTELTAAGEQAVIPGCEANKSPKAKQLSLWG